jgi:hypothetical protein
MRSLLWKRYPQSSQFPFYVSLMIGAFKATQTGTSGSVNHGGGRRRVISDRAQRALVRAVGRRNLCGEPTFVPLVMHDVGLTCGVSTANRALNRDVHITRRTPVRTFYNTPNTRSGRVRWAHRNTNTQWSGMSFYDESRFSLDGSDRPTPMLVDTRVGIQPYLHRPARGGSITLLLVLGPTGFVNVSIQYTNVNGSDVLEIMSASLGAGDSIMMDNAYIHYRSFRELPALGVTIVRQPTYSPDLQPVENVFGLIHQRVYAGNRQFASISELVDRMSQIIDTMITSGEDVRLYVRLVRSMPNRVQRLIDLSGWPVN